MCKGHCFKICELHQQVHSVQGSRITVLLRQILGWWLQQAKHAKQLLPRTVNKGNKEDLRQRLEKVNLDS